MISSRGMQHEHNETLFAYRYLGPVSTRRQGVFKCWSKTL